MTDQLVLDVLFRDFELLRVLFEPLVHLPRATDLEVRFVDDKLRRRDGLLVNWSR